ncbi:MAG: type I-G CRISPR-associated RAMP protein Csb1/Cas7g [Acidimicrobiales bacterium]
MAKRDLIEVSLKPLTGDRFQPTGFPDIGAATYERPVTNADGSAGWEDCVLLESAQSMANHLEATAWDVGRQEPVKAFAGMPYIRVVDNNGDYLTSSRREAHRVASAFVKHAMLNGRSMTDVIKERLSLKDDSPLAPRDIARAIFLMDPMCLVHGVFFADTKWPGQPKVARALTSFVEAHEVRQVISGGVKRDDVMHSVGEGTRAAEGYGFVPFHRTEYVARDIIASFVLDLEQLDSYGLDERATRLLATAARWEVRSLLDAGFRPRTACDLAPASRTDLNSRLPSLADLTEEVTSLCEMFKDLEGEGRPVDVVWNKKDAAKMAKKKEEASSIETDEGGGE